MTIKEDVEKGGRRYQRILLETNVSDVLIEIAQDKNINDMTTSDLQGFCGAKAIQIIKLFRDEVKQCKGENDFERCLKEKGLM